MSLHAILLHDPPLLLECGCSQNHSICTGAGEIPHLWRCIVAPATIIFLVSGAVFFLFEVHDDRCIRDCTYYLLTNGLLFGYPFVLTKQKAYKIHSDLATCTGIKYYILP